MIGKDWVMEVGIEGWSQGGGEVMGGIGDWKAGVGGGA